MEEATTLYRSEHDSVGERAVPKDVYYGVQSLRAAENFHITGLTMHPELINSIAQIKMASAITNYEIYQGVIFDTKNKSLLRCKSAGKGLKSRAFKVFL